ncbi:MAG: hypothetical protein ACO39R_06235 [Pontimonas sp.]|jgi:hypothetical protein
MTEEQFWQEVREAIAPVFAEIGERHQWTQTDEESIRCAKCDARYGGKWHDLPCGTDGTDIYLADIAE